MVNASFTTIFLLFTSAIASVAAQQCGTQNSNSVCAAGLCCSQYGWCDTTAAHCDPANCQKAFSGAGSSCAGTGGMTTSTTAAPPTSTGKVPEIDVCGSGTNGISCPGAGSGGFFYRCCSVNGHCGPKNGEQAQSDYCGAGCQPGYGACDTRTVPAEPTPPQTGTARVGDHCGPIVGQKCAPGLCCSGSNFCGTGTDFCGAANWCQVRWGDCHR